MSNLKCLLFGHNYTPRTAGEDKVSQSVKVFVPQGRGYTRIQGWVECLASCTRVNCGEHMWEIPPLMSTVHFVAGVVVHELTPEAQKHGKSYENSEDTK